MNIEHFQWVDKYRPKTVEETVLLPEIKEIFRGYVRAGQLPNMLLYGPAGVGKTSVALAAINELGAEYIVINGSLNGNIDTIRNDLTNFVTSVSMDGGRKYIIIDEADGLNIQSTQPSLRKFMEDYSSHCSVIMTANHPYKIMKELKSRCFEVGFNYTNQNVGTVAGDFFKKAKDILAAENVEYDEKVLKEVVRKNMPDWRKTLHDLQAASIRSGKIDSGILAVAEKDESFRNLAKSMKKKSFDDVRTWVAQENIMLPSELFEQLYTKLPMILTDDTIPAMILIVAKYQYQSAFVASQDINTAACLTELLMEVEFK